MAGATAKSTPRNTKIDDRELKLLQKQAYWLQVQRTKLLMDLIFVCEWRDAPLNLHWADLEATSQFSVRCIQVAARKRSNASALWPGLGASQVLHYALGLLSHVF